MISNLKHDIESKASKAAELSWQVEAYIASGGRYSREESVMAPIPPKRSSFVDPESILHRKPVQRQIVELAVEPELPPKKKPKRQIEREERAEAIEAQRKKLIAQVGAMAATMTIAETVTATGLSRKVLSSIAADGCFEFKSGMSAAMQNLKPNTIDEAQDAKDAEQIKAFAEIGLSRKQAMSQMGMQYPRFVRLLAKFDIFYPKRKAGPPPAFFRKGRHEDLS